MILLFLIGIGFTGNAFANPIEIARSPLLESIVKDCYASDLKANYPRDLKINGHELLPSEAKNLHWISQCVVPFLPGTKEENALIAAKAAWWSLREGVLQISSNKVFRSGGCTAPKDWFFKHFPKEKKYHDVVWTDRPLEDCPGDIWQVGIAAAQVKIVPKKYLEKTYAQMSSEMISSLDHKLSEKDILGWTAELGGYSVGSPTYRGIVNSSGRVKYSWLQRNPLIATLFVGGERVDHECYKVKKPDYWCFQGTHPQAKKYSKNSSAMKKSISDIKNYFLKN